MLEVMHPPPEEIAGHHDWVISGRLADEAESRQFALSPFPFRVGRKPGLSLTLPRQTVSSLHAEFFVQDQRLFIRDLCSTNGTFVNGQRLTGDCELRDNDLVQLADAPFRISCSKPNTPSHTRSKDACDQALAMCQFERLIDGKGIIPNYQTIVDLQTGQLIAFEALARSRLIGLETPMFMFTAAAQLDSTTVLSQVLRRVSVQDSSRFIETPHLFLNTHPSELSAAELLDSCTELRRLAPSRRITIEIHEAAVTHVSEIVALRRGLHEIDMTLAFDDFGSGQARIAELAEVRPDYLKFDRCIVQGLDSADSARRRVVESLVTMAKDVGIVTLAEGIETEGERDACRSAGFELAQGYYFGRPMPVTHYIKSVFELSE